MLFPAEFVFCIKNINPMKMPFRKNCVISAVGHGSLHRG